MFLHRVFLFTFASLRILFSLITSNISILEVFLPIFKKYFSAQTQYHIKLYNFTTFFKKIIYFFYCFLKNSLYFYSIKRNN